MTTKTEWKEYNGSDEQIADIMSHANGVLTEDNIIVDCDKYLLLYDILSVGDKYLICEPHPLADMICQQARTGQRVWIKFSYEYAGWLHWKLINEQLIRLDEDNVLLITCAPNWNIPNAEYRFTPFED